MTTPMAMKLTTPSSDSNEPRVQNETTPQKNPKKSESITSSTRSRLATIAPDGRRCLVTLQKSPKSAIQVAHIIPQATTYEHIQAMEYHWGLPLGKYSWHTTLNLIYLAATLHVSFDRGGWGLFPPADLVEKIYQANLMERRIVGQYKKYEGVAYDYTLVPLSDDVEEMPIYRARLGSLEPGDHYLPPYSDFPLLKSHVHPFSIIWDAGCKLIKGVRDVPEDLRERAVKIKNVYDFWAEAPPSNWLKAKQTQTASHHSDDTQNEGSGPQGSTKTSSKRSHQDMNNEPQDHDKGPASAKHTKNDSNQKQRREDAGNSLHDPSSGSSMSSASLEEFDKIDPDIRLDEWAMDVACASDNSILESSLLNNEDVGECRHEEPRKAEDSRSALWEVPGPNMHHFSSNDWAYYVHAKHLDKVKMNYLEM